MRTNMFNGKAHVFCSTSSADLWAKTNKQESKQEWLRVKVREEQAGINIDDLMLIPVQVQRCIETIKINFTERLCKLFQKVPEGALYIPDEEGQLSDKYAMPLEPLKKSYLIKSIMDISEEKIRASIDNIQSLEHVDGEWILNTVNGVPSAKLTVAQSEIKEIAEKLIVEISKHGEIVGDFNTHGATRICIGVKQAHGMEDMRVVVADKGGYQQWCEHQVALYRIQRDIAKIISNNNLQFFLEGNDPNLWAEEVDIIKNNTDSILPLISPIISTPENTYRPEKISEIEKLFLDNKEAEALQELSMLGGQNCFVYEQLMKANNIEDNVHGLGSKLGDGTLVELLDMVRLPLSDERIEAMMDKKISEWFQHLHPFIMKSFQNKIAQKGVGILILGSSHYKSGWNTSIPKEYINKQIEDYFEQEGELKDMRLIVVKPRGL